MITKKLVYGWKYGLGVCILMLLAGCGKKKADTITISIPDYQEEYDILTEIAVEVTASPEGADLENLEYIVDSDGIAFSESGIYTGDLEGTFEIRVSCGDVESNTLTVTVVDKAGRAEAERKAEEERQAEEKRLEEEQRRAENLAAQEEALSEEEDRIAREAMEDQESGDASIWIDSNP